eukprot:14705808-Alexandrium_andersonii.AAC.1
MSASLVGSEMCIRDSTHARARTHAHAHKMSCRTARVTGEGRSLQWRAAVSYTHLTLPTICSV